MHEQTPLPYSFSSLEPYIDTQTMEIHYTKHHVSYVNNLNKVLEGYPELQDKSLEDLLSNLDEVPEVIRTTIRNNGGGHYNHSLFWELMIPKPLKSHSPTFSDVINKSFGSMDILKQDFTKAAMGRFGSGWAWMFLDKNRNLKIGSTPNQDNPIMDGMFPILGLDVWEHAYYLKYQNRRVEYIEAWWNVVNWVKVEELYNSINS